MKMPAPSTVRPDRRRFAALAELGGMVAYILPAMTRFAVFVVTVLVSGSRWGLVGYLAGIVAGVPLSGLASLVVGEITLPILIQLSRYAVQEGNDAE